MKPPRCIICGKRLVYDEIDNETRGLVEFKKTESDREWDADHPPEHPPYAEWFCSKHFKRASDLKNLHRHEALKILTREGSE
ncbi:MAG: hypothetical protein ACTSUE_25065 [Promethearchaeota archaeon]